MNDPFRTLKGLLTNFSKHYNRFDLFKMCGALAIQVSALW